MISTQLRHIIAQSLLPWTWVWDLALSWAGVFYPGYRPRRGTRWPGWQSAGTWHYPLHQCCSEETADLPPVWGRMKGGGRGVGHEGGKQRGRGRGDAEQMEQRIKVWAGNQVSAKERRKYWIWISINKIKEYKWGNDENEKSIYMYQYV